MASKSPRVSGDMGTKAQQSLLKAKYPPIEPTFSFGTAPQTLRPAAPAGVHPSPDASPLVSPGTREIPLSDVSCITNPIFGDAADPQKLAASWVTNQQYGDAADQASAVHVIITTHVRKVPVPSRIGQSCDSGVF